MIKSLFLIVLVSIAPLAYAETFLGHVRARPPAIVVDGDHYSGPVLEIIELSLARRGHDVNWLNTPWLRTIRMAKGSSLDLIPSHSMTPSRYHYLLPVLYGFRERSVYFFIRNGSDVNIDVFDDVKKYKVGQLRGSFYSEKYNSATDITRVNVGNLEQLFHMLEYGRIDVAVISQAQGDVSKFYDSPLFRPANYVDVFTHGRYFSIPKHSPMAKFYDEINYEVYKMRKSGEVSKIFSKYNIPAPFQFYADQESKAQAALGVAEDVNQQ